MTLLYCRGVFYLLHGHGNDYFVYTVFRGLNNSVIPVRSLSLTQLCVSKNRSFGLNDVITFVTILFYLVIEDDLFVRPSATRFHRGGRWCTSFSGRFFVQEINRRRTTTSTQIPSRLACVPSIQTSSPALRNRFRVRTFSCNRL